MINYSKFVLAQRIVVTILILFCIFFIVLPALASKRFVDNDDGSSGIVVNGKHAEAEIDFASVSKSVEELAKYHDIDPVMEVASIIAVQIIEEGMVPTDHYRELLGELCTQMGPRLGK